jgi:uncharacterized protein (TIGR02001 family)
MVPTHHNPTTASPPQEQNMMRKAVLAGLLAATFAGPALAADVAVPAPLAAPEAWAFDFAFGGKLMSDYNFRGISQSARGPALNVYGEARYGWLYAGAAFWTTKLPNRPVGEVDLYAGIRPVIGNATFDLGVMYYLYPNETQFRTDIVTPPGAFAGIWAPARSNFVEVYGKVGYDFTPQLNVGAAVYYAPNWLGTGASGTYVEANAKYKLPNDFAISGAVGHYFLGTTTVFGPGADFNIQDYFYWNAGVSWTYKDFLTLDLRYHGTNLTAAQCFATTGDYRGVLTSTAKSSWCGHSVVATLSVDLQWSKLPYR